MSVLNRVKDEESQEKRKLFADYLSACRHPENMECGSKTIYLQLIEKLGYLGVFVLQYLTQYRSEKGIIAWVTQNINKDINPEDIQVHLSHLESLGLTEKISAEDYEKQNRMYGNRKMAHPYGIYLYKRNRLGGCLCDFIMKGVVV